MDVLRAKAFNMDVLVDYKSEIVGQHRPEGFTTGDDFARRRIAPCRTFSFLSEIGAIAARRISFAAAFYRMP